MIGIDKPTGRVVALVVMLVVAAVALRGYLPGAERAAPREQPTNGAASLLAVVALVTASLVIIAIAIIARLRDRRPVPARAGGLPESFRGSGMRPTWRFWLIGLGALIVWLLIVLLLVRLGAPQGIDQPAPDPAPSTAPRGDGTAHATAVPATAAGREGVHLPRRDDGGVHCAGCRGIGRRVAHATPPRADVSRRRRYVRAGEPRVWTRIARAGSRTRTGRNRGPQPRTAGGDHRVLRGDGTWPRERPRRRSAGLRHAIRGAGPGRRTPCAARRQRSAVGRALHRGAVQSARDERGTSRDRGACASAGSRGTAERRI